MKEVEITKIEITIGDKTISLTIDQAKQLQGKLADLFRVRERVVPIPVPEKKPYRPYAPWPCEERPWFDQPKITWDAVPPDTRMKYCGAANRGALCISVQ